VSKMSMVRKQSLPSETKPLGHDTPAHKIIRSRQRGILTQPGQGQGQALNVENAGVQESSLTRFADCPADAPGGGDGCHQDGESCPYNEQLCPDGSSYKTTATCTGGTWQLGGDSCPEEEEEEAEEEELEEPSRCPVHKPTGKGNCKLPQFDTSSDKGLGYVDDYRGWYDVQGCGFCYDYCRWVGNAGGHGDHGDPAEKTTYQSEFQTDSWWSCRLAGESKPHTDKDAYPNWAFKKCAGEGTEAPKPNCKQEGLSCHYDREECGDGTKIYKNISTCGLGIWTVTAATTECPTQKEEELCGTEHGTCIRGYDESGTRIGFDCVTDPDDDATTRCKRWSSDKIAKRADRTKRRDELKANLHATREEIKALREEIEAKRGSMQEMREEMRKERQAKRANRVAKGRGNSGGEEGETE